MLNFVEANKNLVLGLGVSLVVAAIIVARRLPRVALAGFLAVVCLIPYWVGVDVGVYAPPTTVAAAVLVIAFFGRGNRPGAVDLILAIVVVIYLVAMFSGTATISSGFVLIAHWSLGYVLGRFATSRITLPWIYRAIAVAFTIVAVLAIIEFVTRTNVFVTIRTSAGLFGTWGPIQERGGVPRAEGAFGHGIALGASLAIAIPLTLASGFRPWIRASMVFAMLAAATLTFSRIGMISSLLAVLLCVTFLRGNFTARARSALILGTTAVALVVGPLVVATFSDAGDEATASSDYRGDLLSLIPTMALFGQSPSASRTAHGEVFYGGYRSIDSALIYFGLTSGLIPLGLLCLCLIAAVVYVLRGAATAPTIAIVAQIPALTSVALITQYALFFWFVCGLAVSSQISRRRDLAGSLASDRLELVRQP